jgi:hypothetical protein
VPFSVKQKQESRPFNIPEVSFVGHIEVEAYNKQYRLLKRSGRRIQFTVDGANRNAPYSDSDGVRINSQGGRLRLSTKFGLTIVWDGREKADITLCNSYAGYVCGLCGNGDGMFLLLKII